MPPRRKQIAEAKSEARQSPRKRKQDAIEADDIPQPSRVRATKVENGETQAETTTTLTSRRAKKLKQDVVVDEPARGEIAKDQLVEDEPKLVSKKGKAAVKTAKESNTQNLEDGSSVLSDPEDSEDLPTRTKAEKHKAKRKTKEEKEAESMPLATRTTGLNMFVGAHVSIAKGVENAITNAVHIGGNAMALFLQSQRKWENPDLRPENRDAFISACSHHKFDAKQHIVPHGSYLVNLAAKDPDQAKKSYNFFLNDLKRCEALGIKYYNFHPGATNKDPLPDAIGRLAGHLNKALSETSTVVPLLENMAGTESIIGSRFSDLAQIIALIKPEYQSRIGICIDTCHTFAAGYDLRTPETFQKTFKELDDTVGLKYLKAMHINDSKGMFASKKDLHQNIGVGFLGLRAFHSVMNDPRLANIPLILETPCDKPDPKDPKKTIDDKTVWSREIKLLESLIGMDPDGNEYKKLESDLSARGKAERDKMEQWRADKEKKEQNKTDKARKKLEQAEKGQKDISSMLAGKRGRKKKTPSPTSSDSE